MCEKVLFVHRTIDLESKIDHKLRNNRQFEVLKIFKKKNYIFYAQFLPQPRDENTVLKNGRKLDLT